MLLYHMDGRPFERGFVMSEQLQFIFDGPLALLTIDEIYAGVSAELLIQLKEDRRIERKPPGYHPDALGEYFSMWANTSPEGGIVVIGQDDKGPLLGCSALTQHDLNRIEKTAMDYCPDAKNVSKRVEVLNPEGKRDFVVVFRVYYRPDRVVKTVSGGSFVRIGDSKKKLSDHEVRELEIDKGQVEFELEPCGLTYPEDFDLSLMRQFITRFSGMRALSSHSDEEILSLAHLGKRAGAKGFVPNMACALLFAFDPRQIFPGGFTRFLRFEGEVEGSGEKFNAVKDIWLDGNIPNQIAKVEAVLDSQLREFSRLGPDGKFYTAPEYPKPAWYELIVNACVHRSYGTRNMNIFVKMFADRLEVVSPGGFPPLVTPENIYDIHQPRNPYLMEALFYLDLVKCANEGTRRIRDTMADMNLPQPEFKQTQAASHANVRVVLRNNIKERTVWVDSEVSGIVSERILKSLNQHEQRAINFAAKYGAVSVSEVQRLTGRTWPSAKKLLMGLVSKEILEHKVRAKLDRDPQARFVLRKGLVN
jgi:ATP-dependent DNA helicase RecG